MPKPKLMSQKEYLKYGGTRCPFCGGVATARGEFEVDGPNGWQNCECEVCEALWVDHYKLAGYDSFEPGEGATQKIAESLKFINGQLSGTGYQIARSFSVTNEDGLLLARTRDIAAALDYIQRFIRLPASVGRSLRDHIDIG
jgi:hypothetical protein